MEQCYFKKEAVKQKKKEGWRITDVSASRKKKDDSQKLVLMEKKEKG